LEPLIAARAKEKQKQSPGAGKKGCQISDNPVDTKKELAEQAGVSHDTVAKAKYLRDHADEDTKQKLREGTTTVNAEY